MDLTNISIGGIARIIVIIIIIGIILRSVYKNQVADLIKYKK